VSTAANCVPLAFSRRVTRNRRWPNANVSNFLAGGIAVLVGVKAFLDTPGSYTCGAPVNWFGGPSSNTSCDINVRKTYNDVILAVNSTKLPPLISPDDDPNNCTFTFDFVAQNFFVGDLSGIVGTCNDASTTSSSTLFCVNSMFEAFQNGTLAVSVQRCASIVA
jgi:hypothetical protein